MNNFPSGSPLTVFWHFTKPDGSAFSLNGYTYGLYYIHGLGRTEVKSSMVSASGDTLSIVFPQGLLRPIGAYSLQLKLYQNGRLFTVFNYKDAFLLTSLHSTPLPAENQAEATNIVHLYTAAEFYLLSPVIPTIGDDKYWYVNGQIVTDGSGKYVSAEHTVRYDADTRYLIIDEGREDAQGLPIEQVITDIDDFLTTAEENEQTRQENEESRIETEERMKTVLDSIVVNFLSGTDLYEQAVEQGFEGTKEEWLTSTLGVKGVGIASWEIEQSTVDSGVTTHTITFNDVDKPDGPTVVTFNVKNGKGVSSVQQTTTAQESEGVNVITFTFSDGTTATFQVKNGGRGNSGYTGAADELEVVNDLDADDPDADAAKALSAYQGHVLAGKVTELGQELRSKASTSTYTTADAVGNRWFTGTTLGGALTETTSGNTCSIILRAEKGKQYIVTAEGTSSGRAWYFLDTNDNVLSMAGAYADLSDVPITAPEGATKLIVQTSDLTKFKIVDIAIYDTEIKDLQDAVKVIDSRNYTTADAVGNRWFKGTTIGGTLEAITVGGTCSIILDVEQEKKYIVSGTGRSSGKAWYFLNNQGVVLTMASTTVVSGEKLTIPTGAVKLVVQTNNTSNFGVSVIAQIPYDINALKSDVTFLNSTIGAVSAGIKAKTPFIWNKLSRLKALDSGFVNIGFIGDSWTQGTQNIIGGVEQGDYQGYLKPLSKMLQDEYGFGGLGWLDFARDNGNGKMFGCAEMYEHWRYAISGTITGLDGSTTADAPNCLGICCAHSVFANAAALTLVFDDGYLDKFKIRYYKNAHFTVSINNGTAVEVTANSTDGWQETEFGTTGTDITRVVITSLADNTIIFGMDCFYGTKGVRCHKIGNRSISAVQYLAMNSAQWEGGMQMLGLDWASVLLAINDLGTSTSESKMDEVVSNIESLIGRLKNAYTTNNLVTCDISLLGVENIEDSRYTGLGGLARKQKKFAADNGYGWANTDICIGSKKDEFTYTGTFSDQIHLNAIGSYAYAKHIFDELFAF